MLPEGYHIALISGLTTVEILIQILSYLDEVTLASSQRVCRAWRALIQDDFLTPGEVVHSAQVRT